MKILGIETSCDETACSIIKIENNEVTVLSNVVSSQIDIHKEYGGVVPEIAAREHVLNIIPVINEALKKAGINKENIKEEIQAIAITAGPGLITSLMTGANTAKTLAYVWNIPLVPVNHIEGHIYANWLNNKEINFPALTLTVSGGHNMLILMKDHLDYELIGDTRDDAAGEAFDKAAKLLGLGYPGGPIISEYAEKYKQNIKEEQKKKKNNNYIDIKLPRPMIASLDYDFSFSGLKTAILYQTQKDKDWKERIPEYCFEFQQAAVDVLISKTIRAGKKLRVKTIMLSGGVSANKELRKQLEEKIKKDLPEINFSMPDLKYTTDNAVMIAMAGYYKFKNKKDTPWQELEINPNLQLH